MNWTEEEYAAFLQRIGKPAPKIKRNKYHNKRTNGRASAHEDNVAADLHMRAKAERITVLEQVPFELAGGVRYIADFVILHPSGKYEVIDAKGARTDVYKIKAKQMADLWGIEIQEV
jgi:hypothetical protein